MTLRLKKEPVIDNVKNHSAEAVEKLRAMLMAGAPAHPDPRRKNFYELENCSRIYYIHLSPLTGKVMFLAVWDKEPDGVTLSAELSEATMACFGAC